MDETLLEGVLVVVDDDIVAVVVEDDEDEGDIIAGCFEAAWYCCFVRCGGGGR
jgi:hypothetical protein